MGTIANVLIAWHLGDVIRKLRDLAGWNLEQLSAASGIHHQVIHRIERGRTVEPKRRTVQQIALAFGLTERQLQDVTPAPSLDLPIIFVKLPEPPRRRRRITRRSRR